MGFTSGLHDYTRTLLMGRVYLSRREALVAALELLKGGARFIELVHCWADGRERVERILGRP